jgi:hypothetical protein
MTCPHCQLHVPDEAARCPNCGQPVQRAGLLRRILGGLGLGSSPPGPATTTPTAQIRTTRVTMQIKVRNPKTGEVRVYGSLDEVPADLRGPIEDATRASVGSGASTKITVTDASGVTRAYASVEEMPEDLRRIYEQAQQERKP